MGEVQAFTEEHAEGVARVYLRAVRGQDRDPGTRLAKYFSDLHLSNPWASPDIPALVYLEKGKVAGTLGLVPRMMEFEGRPIRIAIMSLYMVDPEHRNSPAGIQLLRRALKGPQELTWTDGASGHVAALWTAMGGHQGELYSLNWIRALRPLGTARMGLDRIGAAGRILKPLSGLVTVPGDFLLSQVPIKQLRRPASKYAAQEVSAEELLGCIQEVGWREPLKPYYTPDSFPWLMKEVGQAKAGKLRMMTVADSAGARAGWFIYYAAPGGASFVLQIGWRDKEDFAGILQTLFLDAWLQGSACVKGSGIPQHLTALTEANCFFRHPYDRVLVHSKKPEIANTVRMGAAAITRLDGIGWLRFSWEKWD